MAEIVVMVVVIWAGLAVLMCIFIMAARKRPSTDWLDHRLSQPLRQVAHYTAQCSCGLQMLGNSLPEIWLSHGNHLRAVQELIDEEW